ncbi:tryptophan--tRNA ligase [Patescibacteria group bacterium]|nr:tryptophan--tRNA ligase [Patescibacteria group bacterium]MBU4162157.1 tryptophan--tRNA ligase [Patescibacteria group bacterium]
MKKTILTGDRPTGPLHLGHYVGSLKNRVELQDKYDSYFIIADYQVLSDQLSKVENIEKNIKEIVLDYLSVGIDPSKSTIFIQSQIPEIAELTLLFSMLITMARVERNPTVKDEIRASGTKKASLGFIGYPVSQAADILCVRADAVPVGKDQLPHIEITREIATTFNRLFGKVFPVPEAIIGQTPTLPGLDGQKMSKSRNNAIFLSDSPKIVEEKVMKAITDTKKIRIDDPGRPEICNIYQYYLAFFPEKALDIKSLCETGKIGCVACKKQLAEMLNEFLDPIRKKRSQFAKKPNLIKEILEQGRKKTQKRAVETLALVKQAMSIDYRL